MGHSTIARHTTPTDLPASQNVTMTKKITGITGYPSEVLPLKS